MVQIKKYITKTLVVFILTGVFVFFVAKFFIIDLARVNSVSMSPTLKPNSLVLVSPISFLSSSIKIDDIIEIQFPFKANDSISSSLFFKRIIALPGDTVLIRESELFINGEALPLNADLAHNYVVKFKQQKDTLLFNEEKITEKYLVDDSCVYLVILTSEKFLEIKNKNVSIKENREDSGLYDENIFPNNPKRKWNKDFFGPLYIPKKNDTLRLDTLNIDLYKKLIVDFENNSLEVKEGKIIINEKQTTYYVAKQNYYFAIGDNFDNSIDSRCWGFIPKKAILAKVIR